MTMMVMNLPNYCLLWHFILWIWILKPQGVFCGPHEQALYKYFLDEDYETQAMARPVLNESEPVLVSLGLSLQQIVNIDEKNQILQLNVWLTYQWKDYRFQWDPKKHGGVMELRFSPRKVWTPDVLLYNSADDNFDSTFPTNIFVRHNGQLEWIPPGLTKSTCKIDITWFPFDDQRCSLKFGSWTFSGALLDLRVGDVNNSTFTENGEWTLVAMESARNEFKYDCCPEPYYDVTFTIWIRRRTLYYVFNLILPCILISFMTVLDFTLPPESGEKLSLGVTIFMSVCVFMLMIAESMPPTSDAVPLIGIYFSSIMIVVSASVVFTVLVLNVHHTSPHIHEMGPWTKKLFLDFLPRILHMKRPAPKPHGRAGSSCDIGRKLANSVNLQVNGEAQALNSEFSALTSAEFVTRNVEFRKLTSSCSENVRNHSYHPNLLETCPAVAVLNEDLSLFVTQLVPVLNSIHQELSLITRKLLEDDNENALINDWKFAATVVDRLSLILFSTVLLASTSGILFAAPHFL